MGVNECGRRQARKPPVHSGPIIVNEGLKIRRRRTRFVDGTSSCRGCCDTTKERRSAMKMKILAIAAALAVLPVAAQAQGVVRGAQDGAARGNYVAGPVGGAVGGVVGGAVGGAVGGVKGVLGIPQRAGYRRYYRKRHYSRHRHYRRYR
jgi:hypothetical protein